ncbi:hypothetical protein, partial [Streptomyces sp. NPDC058398]|uniref:hypothetical protein n=1 Tax=Streptomyces sp. NPDC058398 TaxID=3346479 RepID=UPI0036602A84
MTEVSRTIRNWAVPSTARARQCFTRDHLIDSARDAAARTGASGAVVVRNARQQDPLLPFDPKQENNTASF